MTCLRPLFVTGVLCLALTSAGCGMTGVFRGERQVATLAALEPAVLPAVDRGVPPVDIEQLAAMYRDVLQTTEDPAMRILVLERLAALDMVAGEASLADGSGSDVRIQAAIAAYEALLADHPTLSHGDRMLYQLSKAHDMTGNSAAAESTLSRLAGSYPDSEHVVEARFRLAEGHFSAGRYAQAEVDYAAVVAAGDNSDYFINATYMLAWSQFKQASYRQSIRGFTETLDQVLTDGSTLDDIAAAQRSVAEDCLRVLAFVFSYLEGSDTIAVAYDQLGARHYMPLLYQSLGELYLSQERYQDAASSFRAYSVRYPLSPESHRFHLQVIGIYENAGFPDKVLEEKNAYVSAYGVSSAYFLAAAPELRNEMRLRLGQFIEELATYHHALAQSGTAPRSHYEEAASLYRLYIDSFPEEERSLDMGFLLAEVLTELGDIQEAIARFEWVAYSDREHVRAADAGYAAVLAYERLLSEATEQQRARLALAQSYSQLRFAAVFAEDQRRIPVLGNAADNLLAAGHYRLSLIAAAALLRDTAAAGTPQAHTAQLAEAHAWFELEEYGDASQSYRQALQTTPREAPLWQPTRDRLAASLYREAETVASSADAAEAASAFSRIIEETPEASFRRQAQYDAAVFYMQAAQYREANRLLLDFRERYPGDPLLASVQEKLVFNYEQLSEWSRAARELDSMIATAADHAQQGSLLYAAAEHFDRAGERDAAIVRFRRYAHGWEQPMAPRFEAMRRLAELYDAADEPAKQHFWLLKTMAAHAAAGDAQTRRSLYLAAQAAALLAEFDYKRFAGIALSQPLEKSMRRKQQAMQTAIDAYTKCDAYGVADFAAQCTYRMAAIYAQLSKALLNSPRPKALDGLALEQYELLLEEQAFPFEDKAIAIHEANVRRSWQGWYDPWVVRSFDDLALLSPVRYGKQETIAAFSESIY